MCGGARRRMPPRRRLPRRARRRLDGQARRPGQPDADHPRRLRLRRPVGDRRPATRARWNGSSPSTTSARPSTRCCAPARSRAACTWASGTRSPRTSRPTRRPASPSSRRCASSASCGPRTCPRSRSHLVEVPQPRSPYGIKGVGRDRPGAHRARRRRRPPRPRRAVAVEPADATAVRRQPAGSPDWTSILEHARVRCGRSLTSSALNSTVTLLLDLTIDDLAVDSMRMVRVRRDGATAPAPRAHEHRCVRPRPGVPARGLRAAPRASSTGDVLTCAWHNWKFDVTTGACVLGEEGVRSHDVVVGDDGSLRSSSPAPDPAPQRPRLVASLRRGHRAPAGRADRPRRRAPAAGRRQPRRAGVGGGQLRRARGPSSAGATRVASAVDCLAMVDRYEGDERALPIVQAIAGIAETERGRPVNPLPRAGRRAARPTRRRVPRRGRGEPVDDAQALRARRHRGRASTAPSCGAGSPAS